MNSQNKTILARLQRYGIVVNSWAVRNNIGRLSARIHNLRSQGYEIMTVFKNVKGQRDCKYKLVK